MKPSLIGVVCALAALPACAFGPQPIEVEECSATTEDRQFVVEVFRSWTEEQSLELLVATDDSRGGALNFPDICASSFSYVDDLVDVSVEWFNSAEAAERYWRLDSGPGQNTPQPRGRGETPLPLDVIATFDRTDFSVDVVCALSQNDGCIGASLRVIDEQCPTILFELGSLQAGDIGLENLVAMIDTLYPPLVERLGAQICSGSG